MGHKSWQPWFEDHIYCRGSRIRGDFKEGDLHPLAHIRGSQCHEWLREDCAALELARQQREDNIVESITNISSTALIAIPGLLFGVGIELPDMVAGWALYIGFAAFGVALGVAFWEQAESSRAYARQLKITVDYYQKKSPERSDKRAIDRIHNLRKLAIVIFGSALLLSAFGLSQSRRHDDDESITSVSAAPPTTTTTTTSSSSSSSPSASPSATTPSPATVAGDFRRSGRTEVSAGISPTAAPTEVKKEE